MRRRQQLTRAAWPRTREVLRRSGLWLYERGGELWQETDGLLPGRPCQRCCCKITSDNFDRADNTDLGPKWNEVSGDWEIVSNRLLCDDTSALCIATKTSSAAAVRIKATVRGAVNDVIRLIFNYVDSNNYWYAEFTVGSSKSLLIVSRVAGTDTNRAARTITTSAATDYEWTVCVHADGHVMTDVYTTTPTYVSSVHWFGTPTSTGIGGVGVGTGATASSSIQFDNFSARAASEKCEGECGGALCSATCNCNWMLTVSGITNAACTAIPGCDGFNGMFELLFAFETGGLCTWQSELVCSPCVGATRLGYWALRQTATQWVLNLVRWSSSDCQTFSVFDGVGFIDTRTSPCCQPLVLPWQPGGFGHVCAYPATAQLDPI